ncbi:energy-coupling factor ABC transporter ATP-binding protein [Thermodesulfatator indicus]
MLAPIFEIKNLFHTYGPKPAIKIDHLLIEKAEIIALVGPNGAGKSTLLKLLGLIERPTSGEILFKGKPVSPFSQAAKNITLLPQQPFLLKRRVFENVIYGLKIRKIKNKNLLRQKFHQALELVGLPPEEFAKRPWYALSGGETQRVALACRLALEPEVLLLDEPTASVDIHSALLIKEAILNAYHLWNTTIIIASHDQAWLDEVPHKTWHIFKGHVFTKEINFLWGPWEMANGKLIKKFKNGQKLMFNAPRENIDKPVAIIESSKIKVLPQKDKKSLKMTIKQINKEINCKDLKITASLEDISLNFKINENLLKKYNFWPGEPIYVDLPDQVTWL